MLSISLVTKQLCVCIHRHTHTHTHIYIYIYIANTRLNNGNLFLQRLTAWMGTSDVAKHAVTKHAVTMCMFVLRAHLFCTHTSIGLKVKVILTKQIKNHFVLFNLKSLTHETSYVHFHFIPSQWN